MNLTGYRGLFVKNVHEFADCICINFENSIVDFQINKSYLQKKDIDSKDIVRGVVLYVKGIDGNDDMNLACVDALEDIVLYSV